MMSIKKRIKKQDLMTRIHLMLLRTPHSYFPSWIWFASRTVMAGKNEVLIEDTTV